MADLRQTIEIIFESVDNLGGTIGGLTNDLSGMSAAAQDVTGPLANITETLLTFEAAAIAGGAAMATMATIAAGEFNQSFAEINTLVDASAEDMGAFRDNLLDYASTSSSAFSDITAATYSAISAGVEYGESVGFVADAERLALASKAGLNDTTVLLASTLNAYGASADEAARYSDVLFTTVRVGQTTLPELASSLAQVTGTAAAAGVPIETLAAAVADLTAKGLPTSQAITGIKAALSNIITPSEKAQKAASALGVEFGLTALQSQGLEGFLASLDQATGGNAESMAQFFGSAEALNAVLALSQGEAAGLRDALQAMEDSTGAVNAAFDKMADNFDLVNQRLRNSVTALLVEAGTPLEEQWSEVADAIGGVFLALRDAVDQGAFADVYAAIAAFGIRLSGELEAIAAALPAALEQVEFTGLLASFEGLAISIGGIFDGVDLTTPEGLAQAIQGLIDAFEGLTNFTAGAVRGLEPFIDALAQAVAEFSAMTPEAQAAAGEVGGFAIGLDRVLGLADGAIGALDGVATALSVIAGSSVVRTLIGPGGIVAALGSLGPAAATAGTALAGLASFAAGFYLGDAIAEVTGLKQAMEDLGAKWAEYRFDPDTNGLDRVPSALEEISTRTGVAVGSMEAFNAAVEAGRLVWDETSEQWISGAQELETSVGDMVDSWTGLEQAIGPAQQAIIDAGGSIDNVGDAAADAAPRLIEPGTAVAQTAEEMRKARADVLDYKAAMEALASNERIANMEARVNLETANLEAQTEKVTAAFDSINNTVTETSNNISDLFGLIAKPGTSLRIKWDLEDQIEEENKVRREQLALQKQLIEAEVRQINARSKLLEGGGADVKITSDGLEPALEAFMFQVIDKVRISVASSYDDFLLGCAS